MKKKTTSELTEAMVDAIQGKSILFLQAVEPTTPSIYATALSWVYATSPTTLHFAIDWKSPFLEIIEQNPQVTFTFIGCESTYAITGQAKLRERKAEEISIHLAIVEVTIDEVRDVMFFGGKVVTEPEFIKTYDAKLIEKLDTEVEQAIRRVAKS